MGLLRKGRKRGEVFLKKNSFGLKCFARKEVAESKTAKSKRTHSLTEPIQLKSCCVYLVDIRNKLNSRNERQNKSEAEAGQPGGNETVQNAKYHFRNKSADFHKPNAATAQNNFDTANLEMIFSEAEVKSNHPKKSTALTKFKDPVLILSPPQVTYKKAEKQCSECRRTFDDVKCKPLQEACGHIKCRRCFIQNLAKGDCYCKQCEVEKAVDIPLEKEIAQCTVNHPLNTPSNCSSFACYLCPKTFSTNYKRNRHALTHSGERPFACHICGGGFTRQDHLNRHKKQVHGIQTKDT